MLAQEFGLGNVVVQLHNVQAWEAWKSVQKRANVYDLCKGTSEQAMKRLTVLYMHREVILGVNSRWRLRMVDAKKALRERIDEVRDLASEEFLAKQDQKAKLVYSAAIQRVKAIVDDKNHFGNQKDMSGPEKRGLTRKRKSDLLRNLPLAAGTGHRWHQHKRGYKCERCDKFVTMQSPYTELLQLHQGPCEARPAAVSKGGKGVTRDQLLDGFLEAQGESMQEGKHFWSIGAHYIKCDQCGINLLKRSKMEALEKFMAQDCINHAWQPSPEWKGHRTNAMWRKGNTLQCSKCNGKAQQKDGTYLASSKLVGPCKHGDEAQPSVRAFFQKHSWWAGERPSRSYATQPHEKLWNSERHGRRKRDGKKIYTHTVTYVPVPGTDSHPPTHLGEEDFPSSFLLLSLLPFRPSFLLPFSLPSFLWSYVSSTSPPQGGGDALQHYCNQVSLIFSLNPVCFESFHWTPFCFYMHSSKLYTCSCNLFRALVIDNHHTTTPRGFTDIHR